MCRFLINKLKLAGGSLARQLEEEYHHLSLWYFVFFFYGTVCYFKLMDLVRSSGYLENNAAICTVLAVAFLGFAIFLRRREKLIASFGCLILLFLLLGWLAASYRINSVASVKPIQKPAKILIKAKIDQLKPTIGGLQLVLSDIEILPDKYSKKTSRTDLDLHKISINIRMTADKPGDQAYILEKGDLITLPVHIFPLHSALLPNGYDFGLYNYLRGIQATGYGLGIRKVDKAQWNIQGKIDSGIGYIYLHVQNFRQLIYQRLIKVIGNEEGNFVAAILIGETKAIGKQIATNMRNSGIAHILSVSGLHLSLVAMIFFIGSRFLLNCSNYLSYRINIKMLSGFISIAGSFGYLLLSGSNIAATRAFIMTFIVTLAIILERSAYPLRSVMIAGQVILLFSPEYVMHPSFQLSFSAVLCLISGYEIYNRNKQFFGSSKGIWGWIKLYVFGNIYSSFLGSIVTGPFVIYHFYKFASYSILMNLVAVPIMSFFMMPLVIIWLVLMPFGGGDSILKILGFFVRIVIDSTNYVVSLPLSVINTGYISEISMLVYSFGFFWICLWKTNWRYFGLVIIGVSGIMMWVTPKPDFIYDHRTKIAASKEVNGGLKIYAKNISAFSKDYWLSWYGMDNQKGYGSVKNLLDKTFELPGNNGENNRIVALSYNHCQNQADVQVITSNFLKCGNYRKGSLVVDYERLVKSGVVLIFCNRDECRVQLAQQSIWE